MQNRQSSVVASKGTKLVVLNDNTPFMHPENYGIYTPITKGLPVSVNTSDITSTTWADHYYAILNLLKDGIESELLHKGVVNITFSDNITLKLYIPDYYLNLIMWNLLVSINTPIMSKHVFFADEINKDTIKSYIDNFLITPNRKLFKNKDLNNTIANTLHQIHDIDGFAFYLANTVNLEDNVFLMKKCPEFYECMHPDLSGIAIEDIKDAGMVYANKAISIMKNAKQYLGYDHCLADACRASEGINPKQFKEFTINIGTKPNAEGGIFEVPIYHSFINGGVSDIIEYFIESSTGRKAQIIKFINVGSSGHMARLLGLNNMDSYLYPDPNYDCGSMNYVSIIVKDRKTLKMINNKYYRLSPRGMEYIVKSSDTHLIGKRIYMRSPITCASRALGKGICYKCYGDLAYTVRDAENDFGVNIGRIASENLSSNLTQKLLSAKHLLETFAEKVSWTKKFNEFFEVESNIIRITQDIDCKDLKLIIDPESIELENEEDDDLSGMDDDATVIYNEYITEFDVMQGSEVFHISNDKNTKLYISKELNTAIRRRGEQFEGNISVDFAEIKDAYALFIMPIENNELSKTLEHMENLLNKNSTIKGMTIHQLLQALIDTAIEGGLNIASTHLEVIVSNQVRDDKEILEQAKWYTYNPEYEILSLNRALTCNPSITISMSYQKIAKLLYNPLTFKKNGSSFMDLFFMEQPQYAIRGIDPPDTTVEEELDLAPGELVDPIIFFGDPNGAT